MEESVAPTSPNDAQQIPETNSVKWTASEYIAHEKSKGWHALLFVAAVILAGVVFIFSHDKLAILVILLSAVAMSVYAKKQPSQKTYEVSSRGVSIDEKFYSFSEFRSFSIVEEGGVDSIWLKRLQRYSPTIVMYFPAEEESKIQNKLETYLPYEPRDLDVIDRLMKRIRF